MTALYWLTTIIQFVLMFVLIVRVVLHGQPFVFTLATLFCLLDSALYDASDVIIPIHAICCVLRMLAAMEIVWLLAHSCISAVGIYIAASAGAIALYAAPMQFNLTHPRMWRVIGCAWACCAIGTIVATASAHAWRRSVLNSSVLWMRLHGLIAAVYFAEQTLTYFIPLGRGQGPEWDTWYAAHLIARLLFWLAWLAVFVACPVLAPQDHVAHRGHQDECYGGG